MYILKNWNCQRSYGFTASLASLALEFSTSRLTFFLQVLSCHCRCSWLHLISGDCRWSQWRFFGRFQHFNSSLECLSDAKCQHRNTSNIRLSLPSCFCSALDSEEHCVLWSQGSSVQCRVGSVHCFPLQALCFAEQSFGSPFLSHLSMSGIFVD